MKKGIKNIIIGLMLSIMLISTVGAASLETIKAGFNEITLYVDGELVDTDNILYKGTTYVPLRATAKMLGKNVSFDSKTKTANITSNGIGDGSDPVVGTGISGRKNIAVQFNSINIVVDGKKVNANNILYKGTTYAPIRATSESMGKEVNYDEKTKSAIIGKRPEGNLGKPETSKPGTYDFKNPAPVGVTQKSIHPKFGDDEVWLDEDISILEVIRGDKANSMVRPSDIDKFKLASDEEYLVFKMRVKLNKSNYTDKEGVYSQTDFSYIDKSTNKVLEFKPASIKDSIQTRKSFILKEGESKDFYFPVIVKKNDKNPKVGFRIFSVKPDRPNYGAWFDMGTSK